jgi:hypothetical protein
MISATNNVLLATRKKGVQTILGGDVKVCYNSVCMPCEYEFRMIATICMSSFLNNCIIYYVKSNKKFRERERFS